MIGLIAMSKRQKVLVLIAVGTACGSLVAVLHFTRPQEVSQAVAPPPAAMDGPYQFTVYDPVTHATIDQRTWTFTSQCSADSCTAHVEDADHPDRRLPDAELNGANWRMTGAPVPNDCGTQTLSWDLIAETTDFVGRADRTLTPACAPDGKTDRVYGVTVEKMKPGMNGRYTVTVNDPGAVSYGTRYWSFDSTCTTDSQCTAHVSLRVDPHLGPPPIPDAQLADGRWTITRAPLPNKCGTEDFTWDATTLRGTLTQTVTPACGASGTYPVTLMRQDQFH
ncbi:hypothetical protein [Mycolicibacterium insubricum]|uniref:Uncharacterized protein n=2 Tax=Mycolicibacterium insubricum TaxID=444597 RepID=A0A1X0DMM8_9MYCO|nr:hypothetical protein [Mycolicibacterium insubricum]ORA73615.1 hypothetical protein BST26_02270 [Mycolicibacterium insubricum]